MAFRIELMDIQVGRHRWRISFLGLGFGEFDGHLLYIGNCRGGWGIDFLWLQPVFYWIWDRRDERRTRRRR